LDKIYSAGDSIISKSLHELSIWFIDKLKNQGMKLNIYPWLKGEKN